MHLPSFWCQKFLKKKAVANVHLNYAVADTNPELKATNTTQWKLFFKEDIFVVEGMQCGRRCLAFDGDKFSPTMDCPTHKFHDWAAQYIEAKRKARYAAK